MPVLDFKLQFLIVAVGKVTADAARDFVTIERAVVGSWKTLTKGRYKKE
jgi:hypothetical protein